MSSHFNGIIAMDSVSISADGHAQRLTNPLTLSAPANTADVTFSAPGVA